MKHDLGTYRGRGTVKTLLAAALFVGVGCGPFADPMAAESGNPECGTDALARLIAGRAIDLEHACGTTPVEKCASILKQPVLDKWEPRFTAWEKCE